MEVTSSTFRNEQTRLACSSERVHDPDGTDPCELCSEIYLSQVILASSLEDKIRHWFESSCSIESSQSAEGFSVENKKYHIVKQQWTGLEIELDRMSDSDLCFTSKESSRTALCFCCCFGRKPAHNGLYHFRFHEPAELHVDSQERLDHPA
jgi:hypothetical protein